MHSPTKKCHITSIKKLAIRANFYVYKSPIQQVKEHFGPSTRPTNENGGELTNGSCEFQFIGKTLTSFSVYVVFVFVRGFTPKAGLSPITMSSTLEIEARDLLIGYVYRDGATKKVTTCEICNKVFSPNYTLPPARSNPDVMAIDIRQAWGPGMDIRNPHFLDFAAAERQVLQSEYDDYAIASSGSLTCFRYVAIIIIDATLADSPNIDGHKGLFNGAGLIYILQFSDFTSTAGGFPPPLLCNGSDMVHDTMPKKEAGVLT